MKRAQKVKLSLFREDPDNVSVATDEEIQRLAGKLKRVPLGLTAMRIAYVTDAPGGGRMVISGNKRLRCLKAAYGEDGEVPAEWFQDITAMSEAERHEFRINANISDGSFDAEKLLAQYTRDDLAALMSADAIDELLGEIDTGDNGAADDENAESDDDPDADNPEYQDFVDKFKPKKTTDDCYTPPTIYAAVAKWVADRYNVNAADFARPFYPGGDFERFSYAPGAIVVDNPPFSILSKIIDFYIEKNIRFFLFAPAVSCFNCLRRPSVSCVAAHSAIIYENGAIVPTAFVTNMGGDIIVETAPDLNAAIKAESEKIRREKTKQLRKLAYPYAVATAARLGWLSVHGEKITIKRSDALVISRLDAMDKDDGIYGSGLLLSERAAAERAAAERAAAERAAALTFELSPRELEIQKTLGAANSPRT